jgi:hypothetical protein
MSEIHDFSQNSINILCYTLSSIVRDSATKNYIESIMKRILALRTSDLMHVGVTG